MYEEPVYRPPSEAGSLILQVTIGCSHNRCTFCGMYKGKSFRVCTEDEIDSQIETLAAYYPKAEKIFLADGDVLCLSTEKLLTLIKKVRSRFQQLRRITLYGSPGDVLKKSNDDLKRLKDAGLTMVYLGAESGSDTILQKVQKGAARDEIIQSGLKLHRSGLSLSATMISGLGGTALWEENATESASMMNAMQPDFLSLLTLMPVPGTPLHKEMEEGSFSLPGPKRILEEVRLFVSHLELENCLFSSNHASNYLPISGRLPEEKDDILDVLNLGIQGDYHLRDEMWRGL